MRDFFGIDSRPTNLGKLVFDSPKETMTVWRVQRCTKTKGVRRCMGPFNLMASDLYPEDKGKDREQRTAAKVKRLVEKLMKDTPNTPTPKKDFKGDKFDFSKKRVIQKSDPVFGPQYYFGFAHEADAKAWIGPRMLTALAKYKFTLQPVLAKRVWLSKSKKQVIFVPAE